MRVRIRPISIFKRRLESGHGLRAVGPRVDRVTVVRVVVERNEAVTAEKTTSVVVTLQGEDGLSLRDKKGLLRRSVPAPTKGVSGATLSVRKVGRLSGRQMAEEVIGAAQTVVSARVRRGVILRKDGVRVQAQQNGRAAVRL